MHFQIAVSLVDTFSQVNLMHVFMYICSKSYKCSYVHMPSTFAYDPICKSLRNSL